MFNFIKRLVNRNKTAPIVEQVRQQTAKRVEPKLFTGTVTRTPASTYKPTPSVDYVSAQSRNDDNNLMLMTVLAATATQDTYTSSSSDCSSSYSSSYDSSSSSSYDSSSSCGSD